MIRAARTYVFAVEYQLPDPARISPVLERHKESLLDLGARYVFVYESIVEPGNILVVIGIRTEQPLLNLLRSRQFFAWFDSVGLCDIPAVFAGETVGRFDLGDPPAPGTELIVAAIAPVPDEDTFMRRVHDSLESFAEAGIRRTLVYRAFDNPREVLFLQQLVDRSQALSWVRRSDIATDWLAAAGVGVYPPIFVGRPISAIRLAG